MGWSARTLILTMILVGCGGGASDVLPIGFVNQTQHSVAELWTIWKSAQQSLARKVDLNPLQRSDPGAIADLRPGDSRVCTRRLIRFGLRRSQTWFQAYCSERPVCCGLIPPDSSHVRSPATCVMPRLFPSMTSALPGMRNRGSSRAITSP